LAGAKLAQALGASVVAVGIGFMAAGVLLALQGRVYASLLSVASGATALLVGADMLQEPS